MATTDIKHKAKDYLNLFRLRVGVEVAFINKPSYLIGLFKKIYTTLAFKKNAARIKVF